MKKYNIIIVFCILLVFAVIFGFCSSSASGSSSSQGEENIEEGMEENLKDSVLSAVHFIRPPYIPEEVEFAGEVLPLYLFEVRESLERELIVNMNFHSSTLQHIKKITRFFPVIEPILAANGIPDDFKYLAVIESDLMNKVSPRGATGFWQFMKAAGTENGLEINAEVDERYNVEKSTVAACKYLKKAYRVFGNWTMVAASYNMGVGGLSSQVKRQQCNNYYALLLNDETARYIYRIAAVKLILSDNRRYGFYVPDNERYKPVPYTEVTVNTAVPDLVDFAFKNQTNYKMLKYLNPWLRDSKLTNASKKTYIIKIPAEGFRGDLNHRINKKEAEDIEEAGENSNIEDINK
jgi:hypothetical protein